VQAIVLEPAWRFAGGRFGRACQQPFHKGKRLTVLN